MRIFVTIVQIFSHIRPPPLLIMLIIIVFSALLAPIPTLAGPLNIVNRISSGVSALSTQQQLPLNMSEYCLSNPKASTLNWIQNTIGSYSWLKPDDVYSYPRPATDGLRQISGFDYCHQLNLAVFDVDAPLRVDAVEAILAEMRSRQPEFNPSSPLYQAALSRRFDLMFSPTVHLDILNTANGTADRTTTTVKAIGEKDFIALVDFVAQVIAKHVISGFTLHRLQFIGILDSLKSFPIDQSSPDIQRFACFMAADGSNDWVDLTQDKRKVLRYVDGPNYFEQKMSYKPLKMRRVIEEARLTTKQWESCQYGYGPMDGEEEPVSSVDPLFLAKVQEFKNNLTDPVKSRKLNYKRTLASTRPHRLAYFLLVHERLENVMMLLDALVDPYVTILIHVDGKNPRLKARMKESIDDKRKRNGQFSRVHLMDRSFDGSWGSSALVFSQLEGFFRLMDIDQTWEYVINLSGNDYPLRSNDVIYEDLKKYGSASFISNWISFDAVTRVNGYPSFHTTEGFVGTPVGISSPVGNGQVQIGGHDYSAEQIEAVLEVLHSKRFGQMKFPYSHWTLYKHHQWMILSYDFISELRTSPTAMYLAAYMEWSTIPDESYFATVAKNVPFLSPNIVNSNKRYLEFPVGAVHPRWITQDDLPLLVDEVVLKNTAFTRKIDLGRKDSWALLKGIEKIRAWDRNRNFTSVTQ